MVPIGTIDMLVIFTKVLFAFGLFFIWLPLKTSQADVAGKSFLDNFFVSLMHSNLFFILVVHLLVTLKLYETISLFLSALVAVILLIKYRARTDSLSLGMKSVILLSDFTESRNSWKEELLKIYNLWIMKLREMMNRFRNDISANIVSWILITGILLTGAFIRFKHAFVHLYFAASDVYVHLTWAKLLGSNRIYTDGVYPYGFEAIISTLNKLSQLDPYYIVRFLGPLTGFLILLSLLYFVGKKTRHDPLIVIVVLIFYVVTIDLPENVWRQMSALSMEYAVVFFLPGIHFLSMFFETGDRRKLLLAAECLMLVVLIHPYVAFCLGIAYLALSLVNVQYIFRSGNARFYVSALFAAGCLGLLPLLIGIVSGIGFHATSINYISDSVQIANSTNYLHHWLKFREHDPALLAFLCCLLLWFVLTLFKRGRKSNDFGFMLVALFLYLMYRAEFLGLPQLIPTDRIGVMFTLIAVFVMIMPLYLFLTLVNSTGERNFNVAKSLIGGVVVLLCFLAFPISIPQGNRYQYDDAVKSYLQIKADFSFKDWTIVSPVEEYELVLDYGIHNELWEFVQSLSNPEESKLEFTTNYIFLFTEKIPLGTNKQISEEDALQPFPAVTGNLTDLFYRDLHNRTMLEAKAYYWGEKYRSTHDNIEVFLDTPNMRVYKITQDGAHPTDLLK